MNLDWLRSIPARIGIEGRNTTIFLALLFCASGMWMLEQRYQQHPVLSWVFLSALVLLAAVTILVALLAKPQPSEVSEKYFLQQVDKQILVAGGFQSPYELGEFLRMAHNIEYLPTPSGVVEGLASNPEAHKDIPHDQAESIARQDREGVQQMLQKEAERILSTVTIRQVPGPKRKEIPEPDKPPEKGDLLKQ